MLIENIKSLLKLVDHKSLLSRSANQLIKDIEVKQSFLEQSKTDLLDMKSAIKNKKSQITELENKINSYSDFEKKLKTRLPGLLRSKEIEALNAEILNTQQGREDAEEVLLACLDTLESLEKKFKSNEELIGEKISGFENDISILKADLNEKESALNETIKEIERNCEAFPDEFKNKYKRVLTKLEQPVACVKGGNCSGCYNFITLQKLAEMRKSKLGDCTHCGRILFFEEEKLNE